MELSDIECPFRPLMAGGDGSPHKRANLNDTDDDQVLIEFVTGGTIYEGKGQLVVGNKWSLPQTPRRPSFEIETIQPTFLDFSHVSTKSASFDGISSVLDPWDLQVEITELRVAMKKLAEENSGLIHQVSACQDENLQLLSQKEYLETKLSHRNLAQERIKELQIQLEDARNSVLGAEEYNYVLKTRTLRIERDLSDSITKYNDLKKEQDDAIADLEKCNFKLKQKCEEIENLKAVSEEVVKDWIFKEKWMEEKIKDLNKTVQDLTKTIKELRNEKFELEGSLLDITENQLAQLSGCQVQQDNDTPSPCTPENLDVDFSRSYLRRSLQAEIAATMMNHYYSSIDNDSYRLKVNLPTVLEESELLETETSPGTVPRRTMSIDKGRPKLQRMPNATEEESESTSLDNSHCEIQNDLNSQSVNTKSANNNVERAYGNHRNRDSNNSIISGQSSPDVCLPTSPQSWNPVEEEETINEGKGLDKSDISNSPVYKTRTDYGNGTGSLRKRGRSWGPSLPIHNRKTSSTDSFGVIPETEREHMIKYAYDPVTRSSEHDAGMLSGGEWRTLRKDLDNKAHDNYRKRFAQEEGNEVEGSSAMGRDQIRSHNTLDLTEQAEEYIENFPFLVEELFQHLDILKNSHRGPTQSDLETTSTRFNHLALTFKTEHNNLAQVKDSKLKQHANSRSRLQDIIHSIADSIHKLEDVGKIHKLPEEIIEISNSLKHIGEDLDIHSTNLSRTARRVGMMDVQIRLYKMIEVMVLYVHILRNLYDNVDKDFQNARNLLEEHKISFSRSNPASNLNNNNNDTVSWDEGQLNEGETQRDEDGKPRQILQHLLGPKKSSVGLDCKLTALVRKEKKSSTNVIIRCIADVYEASRCELFWPWTWDETWKGTKQGFSIILMIVGLIIIFRSLFPIVSANDEPPHISDLASIFSKHGDLNHPRLPPV